MISPRDIADAVSALHNDKLVVFPTETVYGLGANALSDRAVAEIFATKQRPRFNPLIVHVQSIEAAETLGQFNETAKWLAHTFWPGALTLVVPRRKDCPVADLATAGLDTIALRVPAHPIARQLLAAAKLPIAAPSANITGKLSPTEPRHLHGLERSKVAVILDAGATPVGVESSIVACDDETATLLRPGGIPRAELEMAAGRSFDEQAVSDDAPTSPGQLESHYAPNAPVRLNVSEAAPNEGLLAFGSNVPDHGGPMRNLSESGDMKEAAANLFRYLHELDAEADRIAVVPIPETGLGEAINDRLKRAAAPRSKS